MKILLLATIGTLPVLANSYLIRDVRVFDGEKVIEHRSVLVEDGKIAAIGSPGMSAGNATVLDGRGRTLLPGLFDAHVHIPQDVRGALWQALALGVTTELDMFNGGERLRQIKQIESEDPADLADIRTAGIGATCPGGHPTEMGGGPIPTIGRAEDAQAFVDARIAEGSDYIKVIYDDLAGLGAHFKVAMLSRAAMESVIAAAHRRHRLAVVHIGTEAQARDAIAAGADGLAHIFGGERASPDFGQFAASHHAFVIATLETLYSACKENDAAELLADPHLRSFLSTNWQNGLRMVWQAPATTCAAARESIRELRDAAVPILAGTDAPVPGTTFGASLHGELGLLVAAGLSPVQALASATSAPARIFGFTDRGRIQPGLRADLVLVEGDPSTDIRATRNIVAVWKRGIPVDRETGRKSVEVIDLTPRFLTFYEAAAEPGVDADKRWELWEKLYNFAALPAVADRKQRARALLDAAWPQYPAALNRIRGGAARLRTDPEKVLHEITTLLHGDPATPVRLLVFVGGFEKNAFSMGRQNGVQAIAIPIEDSDDDHLMYLTHEFTHAVHFETSSMTGTQTLAGVVLGEGLAMRAVQQLRPGFPEARYMGSKDGWDQACKGQIGAVLDGMKDHLGDTGADAVARFTFGEGTTGLHREAYCAGWFVVGRIVQDGMTLADVAHIPADKVAGQVGRAIEEIRKAN